jgi:hypothetical protein
MKFFFIFLGWGEGVFVGVGVGRHVAELESGWCTEHVGKFHIDT